MTGAAPTPTAEDRKAKNKKAKLRSAWISFGGRIVAQIVGAMASVILGILVVTKLQAHRASALREGQAVRN
jgi:hypothetical protein